jgi:ATP-dependent Lon protease
MVSGEHGLVCKYDVVCFDEVSDLTFNQIDEVHMLKDYMANGEFSRGKNPIHADGGIIMLGNVDMESQQKTGHLFAPLPPLMRNDTAFMDRIHAFASRQ